MEPLGRDPIPGKVLPHLQEVRMSERVEAAKRALEEFRICLVEGHDPFQCPYYALARKELNECGS